MPRISLNVLDSCSDDDLNVAIKSALCALGELLAKDIDWDLTKPCNDCPFLKASPFHEGVASSFPIYCDSIANGTFAHTCHKTDTRAACDGPHSWSGKAKHCAGAILMLLKTGRGFDLQLPLLEAAQARKLDLKKMTRLAKKSPKVFTLFEMLRFYEDHCERTK